jgi:hypothetical protein
LSKRLKMCDISAVVGVMSMINVTCGTEPYLPSWAFVSKYVLNAMIIWDSIRIEKVGRHHLCNLPEPTYQRTKVNKRENKRQTIVHIWVRILYFVVIWMVIRLHQYNQAHSTIWQDSLFCKYQNVKIIH